MECIEQCETRLNPFGVVAVACNENDQAIVAFPGKEVGQVHVQIFAEDETRNVVHQCHSTELKALAVNPDCTVLATSSVKGTVV